MSIQDRRLERESYKEETAPKFAHIKMHEESSESLVDLSVVMGILACGESKLEDIKEGLAAQQMEIFKLIQERRTLFSDAALQEQKLRLRSAVMDLQDLHALFKECISLLTQVQAAQLLEGGYDAPSFERLFSDIELLVSRFQLSISEHPDSHDNSFDVLSTMTAHVMSTVQSELTTLKGVISDIFSDMDTAIAGGTPKAAYLLFMVSGIRALLDSVLDDI